DPCPVEAGDGRFGQLPAGVAVNPCAALPVVVAIAVPALAFDGQQAVERLPEYLACRHAAESLAETADAERHRQGVGAASGHGYEIHRTAQGTGAVFHGVGTPRDGYVLRTQGI